MDSSRGPFDSDLKIKYLVFFVWKTHGEFFLTIESDNSNYHNHLVQNISQKIRQQMSQPAHVAIVSCTEKYAQF